MATCYSSLMMAWPFRPIPGCPGRFVLKGSPEGPSMEDLLGEAGSWTEHRSPAARDAVLVALLADGGLISYLREDGSLVHTLNTPDGFRRKLGQLAVALPPEAGE